MVQQIRAEDWLPQGWKIQIRVRKTGKKDRYYIDPTNGYIFRSLKDIDRYLLTGKLGRHVTKTKPKELDNSDVKLDIKLNTLRREALKRKKKLRKSNRVKKSPLAAQEQKSSENSSHKASKKEDMETEHSKMMSETEDIEENLKEASQKEDMETENSKMVSEKEDIEEKSKEASQKEDMETKNSKKASEKEDIEADNLKEASKKEDIEADNSKEASKKEDMETENSKKACGKEDIEPENLKETPKKRICTRRSTGKACRSSRKREVNPFFILDPDQCEKCSAADIPNLSEIIDSMRKEREGHNTVYISAPAIGALLGRQFPKTRAEQDYCDKPKFSLTFCREYNSGVIPTFQGKNGDLESSRNITNPIQDPNSKDKQVVPPVFGDLLIDDPCIDFAIKTLMGSIPL